MFPSKVAVYNDNRLIGTAATTAQANFDSAHPLYRLIAELAQVREATPALTLGRTVIRSFSDQPGLLAVSRFDPQTGREVVLAYNTSTRPLSQTVAIEPASMAFTALAGQCPVAANAPGSITITLPPLGFAVCAARD